MKQPDKKEVMESTFQIHGKKNYSYGTERMFRNCASQVLKGVPIEEACERFFGRVSDHLMEEIRDFVGKVSSEKDETDFVSEHRRHDKTPVPRRSNESRMGNTNSCKFSRRVRNDH